MKSGGDCRWVRVTVWSQIIEIYAFINKSLCNQLSQSYQEHQRLMKPLRKTIRTARTREDYQLYRVTMPAFDPATVRQILMMCPPGHYLKPDQPFASLFFHFQAIRALGLDTQIEQGGFGQLLSTHISGTIERHGSSFFKSGDAWGLGEGVKKASLELLYLRQCQHFLKKQSIDNGNNKVNFNLSPGQICQRCGKEVWIYTSPDEQIVTTDDLIKANSTVQLRNLLELEWTIIVNQQFTPTTVIAKVGQNELYYPILGKATYLLGQGEKPVPNGPIMKVRKVYCYHQKVLQRRCQICLQIIQLEQLQQFNRYLFQYNSKGVQHIFTKGTALQHQEEEYINSMISKKKLILILDLDNTILHSTEMSELDLPKVLKIRQYFIIPRLDFNSQGKVIRDYVLVKMRPYFRQFLFVVSKLFEVYVYTKGTRMYADQICKWIRWQWGGSEALPFDFPTWVGPRYKFIQDTQCFLPYRVLSRSEDASLQTKSMNNILPNRTEYHIILDDRRDVWANSPSWYYTRQYLYFVKRLRAGDEQQDVSHYLESEEDAHPFKENLIDNYNRMREDFPPKKQYEVEFSTKDDNFLLFAAHTLKKMHSYFFDHLKQKTQQKAVSQNGKPRNKHPVHLSNIMQRLKLFLAPKKYRFFLAPDEKGVNMLNIIHRAQKMGAIILDEKSEDTPDLVIRSNNYIKYIRKYYAKKNEPCPEVDFPFNQKLEKLITQPSVYKLQLDVQKQIVKEEPIKQQIDVEQEPKIIILPPPTSPSAEEITPAVQPDKPKKIDSGRDFKLQLKQLKNLARKNIPVISETWVLACYEFSYRFKAEDFRLIDPTKEEVKHEDFNEIMDRAAEKIRKLIVEDMKEEIKGSKSRVNSKGQNEKQINDFPQEEKVEKGADKPMQADDSKKESHHQVSSKLECFNNLQ